jgi:hypothetical protein
MAYRSQSTSLAVLLALLLSLHSTTSFSLAPSSYPITRIKQVHIASSPLSPGGHDYRRPRRRHHHRQTAVGAVDANPLDDWEPNNDIFSRLKASPVAAFLYSCFTGYLHLCENRPFVINSIAAGVLAGVGDMLAQSLQASSATVGISSFNWVRWRKFMLTGFLLEGPWMTFWYKCLKKLGHWMEKKFQSGPRQQVLGQVVAGRTLGAVIYFPMYFVVYESIGAILCGQGKYDCFLYYSHSAKELETCY